jgi:hypothetical protein
MTKFTEMNATARRNVARGHRTSAAVLRAEMDKLVGFSPKFAVLKTRETFHSAQAKLWESAAAHAEYKGNVRLA